MPTNPNTTAQQAVRNQLRILVDAWTNSLTPTLRDNWNLYAFNVPVLGKLGTPIKVSGQNMYVRANLARLQAGEPRVDTAPGIFDLGSFTPITASGDASADTLTITFEDGDPWANEAGGFMFVYQSRPQNNARNFWKGPYQLLTTIVGDAMTPPTSPATVASLFPLSTGQRVFLKINVARADGRYTDPQYTDLVVVP